MTQRPDEPLGVQRAALSLHALAPADREWVLQSLPAAERDALQPLLLELHALGIPSEASLLDALLRNTGALPIAAVDAEDPFERLDARGFAALAAILSSEPGRITGALLASRAAPLRDRLLASIPRSPGDSTETAQNPARGRALQAAVAAELAALLRDHLQPRAPAPGRWGRFRSRLLANGRRR